jgi:hypothetical protein
MEMNNKDCLNRINFRLYALSAYIGGVEVATHQAAKSMTGLIDALNKAGVKPNRKAARG